MNAEKQREWRKESGLCTQCGERLPEGCSFTTCDGCRAFRMLNYKARKKNNECVSCGKEDAFTMNGRALCADCAAKMAEREKAQRAAGADWSKKDITIREERD